MQKADKDIKNMLPCWRILGNIFTCKDNLFGQ